MNLEEQFDLWESELSFRERAELALDFIDSQASAFGTVISVDLKADTALIHYDLQTEFMNYLRNIHEETELEREEEEIWTNYEFLRIDTEDEYEY